MLSFLILSIALTILVAALLISLAASIAKLKVESPKNSPERWLLQNGRPSDSPPREKPVIVCAGDSLTHGTVSANWVNMLQERLPQASLINAGINSELAYNLYGRLDSITALDPDFVVVLIGTNDANSTFGLRSSLNYLAMERLPELPTPMFYREMLTLILRKLKNSTKAQIAVVSIPPIGEDQTHYAWIRADEYAMIGKETAFAEKVYYIPLHERMCSYIETAPKKECLPFDQVGRAIKRSIRDHYLFGKSWDEISAGNGFHVMLDGIHFNSHGATMMADLAERFIRDGMREARAVQPTRTP